MHCAAIESRVVAVTSKKSKNISAHSHFRPAQSTLCCKVIVEGEERKSAVEKNLWAMER